MVFSVKSVVASMILLTPTHGANVTLGWLVVAVKNVWEIMNYSDK